MANAIVDPTQVLGWGVDIDPRNDPTYPMRDRTRDDTRDLEWSRPALQQTDLEILRSSEHVRLPAVLGDSVPPKGLSGAVRRWAFRYSESQWAHWLLLIGADRINMIEGLGQDLARGRVPNLFAEMGLGTELRYNRKRFLTGVAVTVGVVAAAVAIARLLDD